MRKEGSMARWGILLAAILILCQCVPALNIASTQTPPLQPAQSPTPTQTATAQPPQELVVVNVSPHQPGYRIPANFLGLSYEAGMLAQDDFDTRSTTFIHLLRDLGQGVLRFGGDSVENTYWDNYNQPSPNPIARTIRPADLDRLFAFAKQVNWGIILGVNLGDYLPQMAADEAWYALNKARGQIVAIEIGNEPDSFALNGLRPKTWGVQDFRSEFDAYVIAIHEADPDAPIAGPATSESPLWFSQFLNGDSTHLALATHHIYPLNASASVLPTSHRYASISQLLSADTSARINTEVEALAGAAAVQHFPLRIGETNSASHGGKDGVSNVFASALWGSDYLFMLATHGVAGANFHGDSECTGYTAICLAAGQHFHAQPLYYGMLFFHLAAENGQLVPATIQTSVNVTAYAVMGDDKSLRVALINKTEDQDVTVQVNAGQAYQSASILSLTAPSLAAQDGITFGGSAVAADGSWTPTAIATISPSEKGYQVSLPAASALLLILR
ncbi:MAG TPA: glycosyl hydrolase family 79 C-terminal domain-containing protein [Anaerolineaceae bacterium]|nr:glycosyl hydrolase family 79 C-terminal domain-containing protein [Anaerolineaceae bacterium]